MKHHGVNANHTDGEVIAMKRRYLAFLFIAVLFIAFLIPGCKGKNNTEPSSGNGRPEYDWVMKVEQTIPKKYADGKTVEHTLVFIAKKEGGTDVTGTYHGAFCLRSKLDNSESSNEVVYGFGRDVNFDVVAYDAEKFAGFGELGSDKGVQNPIDYETMATFAQEMTGSAVFNPYVSEKYAGMGSGSNENESGSVLIPVKIAIKSGKVYVDFPTLDIEEIFEGQVTEVPLGDNSQYDEFMAKIEAMEEAGKSSGSPVNDTKSGNTGDSEDSDKDSVEDSVDKIGEQTGEKHEVPDSFPSDDVPVIPNAKIIDFYENARKTNVAVVFGTDKSFDEALKFYQENFLSKLKKEPTKKESDSSVMFICEMEGYSNIAIAIMEDQSKTYGSIVALEVFK